MLFFWSWNAPELIWDDSSKNVKFRIFSKFSSFFRHISWPVQVFPASNWAHIDSAQSFKIVFNTLLRISWSVRYIYQKYGVKGSKSCTSAGTPKSAEGAAVRKIKESASHHFVWKSLIFALKCCFFGLGTVQGWSGIISEKTSKIQIFIKILTFFVTHFLNIPSLPVVQSSSY